MKKLALLTCAFVASTMAFAQDLNLAISPVGDNVTVTATASIHEGNYTADNAIDGKTDTRWGSNGTDNTDTEWFQIEWSEAQTFNTIKLLCEGAMNASTHSYDIQKSDNGTTWTTIAQIVDKQTPADEYETIKFDEVTTKYVRLQGVKKGTYGYSFYEFEVYNIDYSDITLGTFTIPGFAKYDEEGTTIAISLLDTHGEAFNVENATFSISEGASVTANDNELTIVADEAGTYTITAKAGDVELTADIVLLSATATVPTDEANDVYAFYSTHYDASTVDELLPTHYFNGYKSAEVVAMKDDDNVYYVTGAGSFGLRRGTPTTSEYNSLKFDIYAFEDILGNVQLCNSRDVNTKVLPEQTIQLKGGQWNHVEVSLADAVKTETIDEQEVATKIGFVVWTCETKGFHNLLIDNVYLSTAEAIVPEIGLTVIKDSETEWTLAGKAKTANELNEAMNDVNVTYYDLTGLELAEGITTIAPANPNALILVAKSEADAQTILTGTNNVIYKNGNAEWLFPVRKLIFNGNYSIYNGHMISTGNTGYKYTRKLEADKYVTVSLPVDIAVPEGTTAYEFVDYTDETLNFNKVETITANTPYVLHVTSAAEIVAEGTEDVLKADYNKSVEKNGVKFHTNNVEFTATGAEYGLQNATDESESVVFKNVVAPAKIGAFRAYFTLDDNATAKAMTFNFNGGTTTGINTIATDAVKTAGVYSIDGRFINATGATEKLAKGLYIVNGKKVIVK